MAFKRYEQKWTLTLTYTNLYHHTYRNTRAEEEHHSI